jgi:major membrane immunogen (membrane-anchored lipoprotein)
MKNKLTRLTVRVIQPPISIFEIGSGKEIERTYAYESAFANADHYFFMVPDGRYKVLQGDSGIVCCYDVKGGKVSEVEVEVKPKEGKAKTKDVKDVKEVVNPDKGVTLDDVVATEKKDKPKDKKDKNSVTGIMHIGENKK